MMVGTHTGTGYSLNAYAYLLAALLLLVSATTVAEPAPVTVESMAGTVEYRQSNTTPWARASVGIWLAMPVEIKTGPDAKARITQSGTSLDIGSNTRLTLSSNENASGGLMSRVKHWLGTVFYEVERQPDTFQVETPFLVSTVKGTQFTIATTETSSLVTLNEGSLEVRDLKSGDLRLLEPGDIAGVTSSQVGIRSLQQAPNAVSPAVQTEALNAA